MSIRGVFVLILLILASVGDAGAQNADRESAIRLLKPELSIRHALFLPSQPLLVRFTIFNPTDRPIALVVSSYGEASDGLSLPQTLIVGDADRPALSVMYEGEHPTPVRPPKREGEPRREILRLAPNGAIGAEIDVASLHRVFRYPGLHKLQWRPLGDQTEPATISFRVESRKDAVLITDLGKITFALMYDQAPKNVENFLELARRRFYDGKSIHRLIPNFIMQGGSPDGRPTAVRPDGQLVEGEFHSAAFVAGTLAMARKPSDPDSASCQFFVSLARLAELDGRYTVIGQARDEESLRTLQQINELPTTESNRPVRPLVIRFLTLVDADQTVGRSLDVETTEP